MRMRGQRAATDGANKEPRQIVCSMRVVLLLGLGCLYAAFVLGWHSWRIMFLDAAGAGEEQYLSAPRPSWPQPAQYGPTLVGSAADIERPDIVLERLAFGSCNKAWAPQRIWGAVRKKAPQVWLWTGDAVYVGGDQPCNLADAYRAQHQQAGYRELLAEDVIIDGVYDDHDYGGNDSGRHCPWRLNAQQLFLDFIQADRDSARRTRRGVFSSYLFGDTLRSKRTRVILLDTRYHRDNHVIPSVAAGIKLPFLPAPKFAVKFPLMSLVAASIRMLTISMGIGEGYTGDILGEEQWQWLEQQLRGSDAGVHIIVSSIQVLTSNPLVESWAHFPAAKRRLLRLLQDTNPANLLLVSGDVHYAELSGNPPLELTSSGMTHTCATTFWARLCGPLVRAFSRHRRHPASYGPPARGQEAGGQDQDSIVRHRRAPDMGGGVGAGAVPWEGSGEGFYTGYNFGLVTVQHNATDPQALPTVWASAHDVNGTAQLRVQVAQDPSEALGDAISALDEQWEQARGRFLPMLAVLALGCAISVKACAVLVSIADPSCFFGLLLLMFCWKSSELPVEVTYVVIFLLVVFLWKYQ